jgi:hypothetical protein
MRMGKLAVMTASAACGTPIERDLAVSGGVPQNGVRALEQQLSPLHLTRHGRQIGEGTSWAERGNHQILADHLVAEATEVVPFEYRNPLAGLLLPHPAT